MEVSMGTHKPTLVHFAGNELSLLFIDKSWYFVVIVN